MNSATSRTLVLAGGSGFLGSALARYFSNRGWKIAVLTRDPSGPENANADQVRQIQWDAKTLGDWVTTVDGCDVLINLAGRSVNCRFTPENRKEILNSRIDATKVLDQAISRSAKPPPVWLNASGVGIYDQSFDRDMDESSSDFREAETGASFMGKVVLLWERALAEANTPRTRKVALRVGMVLGSRQGTAFAILRRLARFGLAGTMGSGRQFVSWIHECDLCRALEWIIQTPDLNVAANITAPQPVTNADFMRTLRRACGRSFGLPAPRFALKLGGIIMRTEPDLILDSRRVVPTRLLETGFTFDFPTCASALRDLGHRP